MNIKQQKAFTLVELIVVITILAILGTIAFISLQGYSKDARDSTRISDLSTMKTSLELFHLNVGKYPNVSNPFEVTLSGGLAWTQGIFGNSTFINVEKLDKIPTDPLNNREYAYSITATKQDFQLGGIIEGDSISLINETYAADKTAKALITGTYNGQVLKVQTGGLIHILAVPSIITSEEDILENIYANNSFVFKGYKNLPYNYAGTYNVTAGSGVSLVDVNNYTVYSSESLSDLTNPEDASFRIAMLAKIKTAYIGSPIANEIVSDIMSIDTFTEETSDSVAGTFVNNNLGGSVSISTSVNTNYSCETEPTGININSVQEGYPTESNQVWQRINILGPCYYSCNIGWGGNDCNIDITGLTAPLVTNGTTDQTTGKVISGSFTYTGGGAGGSIALISNDSTPAADPSGINTGTNFQIDFGAGDYKHIRKLSIAKYGTSGVTYPITMKMEWSDDNSSFTQVGSNFILTAGIDTAPLYYEFPASGVHRYWKVSYVSGTTGGNVWLQEIGMFEGAVVITGTTTVGEILTGNYNYFDIDGDSEGTSTYRWLKSDTIDGIYTEISGATNNTYTLTLAEENKFIKFEVTPVSSNEPFVGTPGLSEAVGSIYGGTAPLVTNGTTDQTTGKVISGSFTYTGGGAGGSIALISNDSTPAADPSGINTGTNFQIDFGAGDYKHIRKLSIAKYGTSGVTYPITMKMEWSDDNSSFTQVGSNFILTAGIDTAPLYYEFPASGVHRYWKVSYVSGTTGGSVWLQEIGMFEGAVVITGTTTVGEILTGNYNYFDIDGDSEGASTYRWLKSDTIDGIYTEISGATNNTYTLTLAEENKFIKFEVTPVSVNYPFTGIPVLSEGV